jgi:hypothetical protein
MWRPLNYLPGDLDKMQRMRFKKGLPPKQQAYIAKQVVVAGA